MAGRRYETRVRAEAVRPIQQASSRGISRPPIHAAQRGGIQRVFDVDEGADASLSLGLGEHGETEGGFAGRLWSVDLGDAAERKAGHGWRHSPHRRCLPACGSSSTSMHAFRPSPRRTTLR